jgi:hypothetical protein
MARVRGVSHTNPLIYLDFGTSGLIDARHAFAKSPIAPLRAQ